ncbi:Hypothetical predicted protein [Olea europaea subsp. europaea]|nr:Hypothetical predicted protein [Olea europaea subsp. europaea]
MEVDDLEYPWEELLSQCSSDDVEVNLEEMINELQQMDEAESSTWKWQGLKKNSCKDDKSYIRSV